MSKAPRSKLPSTSANGCSTSTPSAQQYFTQTLFETNEGRSVGLSYFKERDFREATIKSFSWAIRPTTAMPFRLTPEKCLSA